MTPSAIGFEFGQSESLTRRIAGLIGSYRPGIGILKEFLQNADDAGATGLRVVLDLRTHVCREFPDERMTSLCGPALLLANDARFTADDLQAIRRISESSKYHSGPKTGRYGLGFNTAYNVTDHPAFVTNDKVYCFDPHRDTVARGDGPGRGWLLTDGWREFPDWPRLFAAGGLAEGCEDLDGTIFRLPFRPDGRTSEICSRPFAEAEIRSIFAEAAELGSALLLFTRNLERLTIAEVDAAGTRELLRVELAPDPAFRAIRAGLNTAVQGDVRALLAAWRSATAPLPLRLCASSWRVETPTASREEHWRMCMGLARGADDRLLRAAQAMVLEHGEKAIPWLGVAARVRDATATPVPGTLYCGLPLPVASSQPVHINGYFDLDSSRQHLTAIGDASGDAIKARLDWNATLLAEGVAPAWAALMTDLATDEVNDLYALFPVRPPSPGPLADMVMRAYAELAGRAVVRAAVSGGTRLVKPSELRLPVPAWRTRLAAPLIADELPVPSPAFPEHVEANFGAKIPPLKPADLRQRLRQPVSAQDLDCPITDALRPCLRQRGWIEHLLAYALSDGAKELKGLPLLVLGDGKLHTIGAKRFFFATEELRALFAQQRHWFVDPAFATATGLAPVPEVDLLRMDLKLVILNLKAVLGKETVCAWDPDGPQPPHRDWLRRLLHYLAGQELGGRAGLAAIPLLPGDDGRLYAPQHAERPFVPADDVRPAVLAVLRGLGVVVLAEHATYKRELRELLHKAPAFGRPLTGPALVDALSGRSDAVRSLGDDAAALLDLLAESRWTYTPQQLLLLRALPLFPSDHGPVALGELRVFLPSEFRAPDIALDVRLLQHGRRWGRLYELLGAEEIDATGYLKQALLPALDELPPDDRHRALEWLRDSLPGIRARLGQEEAGLFRTLREVPLVLGFDGELHPIAELHDPDSALVHEVLGAEARYPDMGRYASRRDAWLTFFRSLGLVRELTKERLVRHVEVLAARGIAALPALERVFKYFDETLPEATSTEMLAGLRSIPWLPVRTTSKALGFAAFTEQLCRPGELALDERLVGSRLPVLAWKCRRATAVALGLIREPKAQDVLAHLQRLLAEFADPDLADEPAQAFGSNFQHIVRYLDRFCGEPRFTSHDNAVLATLRQSPCIWDPRTRRLWCPADVFAAPVPFFEPLRTHVIVPDGGRFLARLGRRDAPGPADYAAFLADLRDRVGDAALDEAQRLKALHAIQAVMAGPDGPLPLLTADGRLVDSDDLYRDDAPWLRGRLGDGLAIAAPEVPALLLDRLQVRRLSVEVQEKIAHIDCHGVTDKARDVCTNFARRIASPQFAAGLARLVRHEHGVDAAPPAITLAIEPVARVEVELVLVRTRSLGSKEAPQYFDDSRPCLYLVGHSEARLVKWVAQAVTRLLGALALRATAASLEHILACEAAEIDAVLNEDRIPQSVTRSVEIAWSTEPAASQATGDGQDAAEPPAPEHPADAGGRPVTGTNEPRPTSIVTIAAGDARDRGAVLVSAGGEPRAMEVSTVPAGPPGAGIRASGTTSLVAADTLSAGASASRPPTASGDGAHRTRRDGVGRKFHVFPSRAGPKYRNPRKQRSRNRAGSVDRELSRRREQGFSADPKFRRAVEQRGMDVAMEHFEKWAVKNTSENCPYDLLATLDGVTRYVEVKGTTGGPDLVTVTYDEVEHALTHPDESVLIIVYGVVVTNDESGAPVGTGGKKRVIDPWRPLDKDLKAIAYRYKVPRSNSNE